jgi:hypothetical protein
LLGWQTHETQVLGETTLRSLIRSHGQVIRQTEQKEVDTLAARADLAMLNLHLVPHNQQRRRAGWPMELNAAVEAALAAKQVCPPKGVSWADWERVLAARRAEAATPVEDLRLLGPMLEAEQVLEAHRHEAKNEEKLDELIGYLQARAAWMVNYRQRRIERRYIGSGHAEKANDLIVVRRQKNRGMQWSLETSDVLAALRTLMLNGGWDRYWQQRKILTLLAS